MKILHTVKYYEPSKGGMESVVKNIIEGINEIETSINFYVYSNNHFRSYRTQIINKQKISIIKASTPIIYKSQPLNLIYKELGELIDISEIIHHHYPFPNMELNLIKHKKKLKTKKFILTWHANINTSRWSFLQKFYSPITRQLLEMADHIVVTSEQLITNSTILDKYLNKIRIIPLSFSPEFENESLDYKLFPYNKNFKLLFVGKLRNYKGVHFLLDAIRDLNVNLTIVGDGEELYNLKNLVDKYCLSKKVEFINNISQQELIKVYQESHLFVLPSVNEAEAFGVVQLEAMANGLPVINTNINSGVPYVSIDSITGFTVNPSNSNELKEAIVKIIYNPSLYELFSKNAIQRSSLFTRKKMVSDYLNLYKEN